MSLWTNRCIFNVSYGRLDLLNRESILADTSSTSKGFAIKSSAPERKPLTFVCCSLLAEIIITGVEPLDLIVARISSPAIPGRSEERRVGKVSRYGNGP